MSTLIDNLRDAANAARVDQEIGTYRRRRGVHPQVPIIATRTGTKIPAGHLQTGIRIQVGGGTSTGTETDVRLLVAQRLKVALGAINITIGIPQRQVPEDASIFHTGHANSMARILASPHIAQGTLGLVERDLTYGLLERTRTTHSSWREVGTFGYSMGHEAVNVDTDAELTHPGLAGIEWLHAFLGEGVSRDHALKIASVPPATFYAWQNKPLSAVRPKTIAHLLRVNASLKLLETAHGSEHAHVILNAGSPNLLHQLVSGGAEAEAALKRIADRAQPAETSPAARVADRSELLARLRSLDAAAESQPDPSPLGGAAQIDTGLAEQLRDDMD